VHIEHAEASSSLDPLEHIGELDEDDQDAEDVSVPAPGVVQQSGVLFAFQALNGC
jgi:hypothetical protein